MENSYKAMLFLHIVAVVVVFGSTYAFPFLQAFAEPKGVATTRFILQFFRRMNMILVNPGAILVALLGVGLIFNDITGYDEDFPTWLMFAIAWFVVTYLVAFFYLDRVVTAAAIQSLEGLPDGPLPDSYKPHSTRIQIVGGLVGLSIAGISFLMVWKPGE